MCSSPARSQGCQRTCIQKYLVQQCGCGDPRFPAYQNFSNCPVAVAALRECLRVHMKHAARLDTCICQQPCKWVLTSNHTMFTFQVCTQCNGSSDILSDPLTKVYFFL